MKIKYLVTDVDGSLTDGKIYMGNDGECCKAFSIKDGYAVNYILKPNGIETIVITGRNSKIVENRCQELGIEKVYQGKVEKLETLKEAVKEELATCAYFGDDVLDLKCMVPIKEAGGIAGCPADAVREVKAIADFICLSNAGEGAFREFCEWLVHSDMSKPGIEDRVNSSIRFIKDLDKRNLKVGRYDVNDDFFYLVQEYVTKPESECVLESHKKNIDIQWIVEGEEIIYFADVLRLKEKNGYDHEKDVVLWKTQENMGHVVLKQDDYIVLYPENAHMGCVQTNEAHKVRKIIGKVKCD